MLTTLEKRILLFLIGCIGVRLLFVYFAYKASPQILKIFGAIGIIIGLGFASIYLFGWRKTGAETMGDKIWWNSLRPFHALTYLTFGFLALTGHSEIAWKILLLDVSVGLGAFIIHHTLGKN